jgi:tetratricopeptide (TPR) repeat protein
LFISYTEVDRLWAEWIAWQFEAAGYSTRLQAWDFGPGSDFIHEMEQAVANADRTIAVLSPDYLSSRFGEAEWRIAFARDPTGEQRRLIPVRVRQCNPPGLLKTRVWIDLVDVDEDTAKQRLLASVGGKGVRPSEAPRFPGSGRAPVAETPRFPGDLPPVWFVPYQRNPNFVGRDSLFALLDQGFARPRGEVLCQVLTGMGGIGKTQLALEFAHRRRAKYELVWWVRAEDRSTLIADYTALGNELGLPVHTDQDATVAAICGWLRKQRRWLVVFDGVDGPRTLDGLLPNGGEGHVLLTSPREVDWDGVAHPVPVEVLLLPEATTFLLTRTGQSDAAAAEELATQLGCLPLALEQAGALIAQTGVIAVADYVELFRQRSRELLARGQPMGVRHTVNTTWNLSLQRLQQESSAAVQLLHLAAFLGPDDLPWHPVVDHAELLPEPLSEVAGDRLELGEVVTALRRYSLVKASSGGLVIHRLLQTVIRERLVEEEQTKWAGVAVRLLDASFPTEAGEPSNWPACQRLLSHGLNTLWHAERFGVEPDGSARLLGRVIDYLIVRGQLNDAEEIMRWMLPLAEAASRPRGPSTAAILRSLGRVLRDLGRPAEARAQLEQALAIDQEAHGPWDWRVADDRYLLGRILRELGDLIGAWRQLQEALSIDQRLYGSNHRRVAEDRRSLGRAAQNLGDLVEARTQLEQALVVDESLFGSEHWIPAYDRCQLGTVLRDLGDLPRARAHLERALEIDERAFGREHWRAAQDRRYLGTVLRAQGNLAEARARLQEALLIDEIVYGADNWRAAQDRRYLGIVLRDLGDLTAARTELERALAIDQAIYGSDHWRAAQDHRHLGRVLQSQGDLEGARAELELAMTIDEAIYSPDDWRIAEDCRYYSLVLRDIGDLKGARAQLERALDIDDETYGSDHWRVAQDHRYLGRVLQSLGDLKGARAALERALATIRRLPEVSPPVVSVIRNDLEQLRRELR